MKTSSDRACEEIARGVGEWKRRRREVGGPHRFKEPTSVDGDSRSRTLHLAVIGKRNEIGPTQQVE